MRLTSKSTGAVLCLVLVLLLILFEIRAHNRLHTVDAAGAGGGNVTGGKGGGWGGLGFAEHAAIHDPVQERLAALEAKLDEIAALHTSQVELLKIDLVDGHNQVDELGLKLTASLDHIGGQLMELHGRGDGLDTAHARNKEAEPGGGGARKTPRSKEDVAKLPLPRDFNGIFQPSCCNFAMVRERIDRIQNSSCNRKYPSDRSNLVYFYLTSHGFGVDIMGNIANVLWQRAVTRGLPFWISDKNWHYAKGVCPEESLRCYFKHIDANCVPGIKPFEFGESLDGLCCSKERLQYFAYEYLTQPLPKYQQLSEARAESIRVPDGEPCAAIHVRRGDSLLNKGYNNSGGAVYRNVSVAEYMETAGPWLDQFKIKHMLLMSDDADAIAESRAFTKYTWHTLDRQRFTSANGVGWENHFPAGSRANEVIDILALRSAVKRCSLLVGSQSQFGISLWKGMMAHQDAPFVYVETRTRNLLYKNGDPRQSTKFAAPPYAANANDNTVSDWVKQHEM